VSRDRRLLSIGGLLLLALGALVALRWHVATDITHFLPEGEAHDDVHLARELAAGELSRTMVLLVDAPDASTAAAVSRAFEAELRGDPVVADGTARLVGGSGEGVEDAMWQTYSAHRVAFLADSAEQARARLAEPALRQAARALRGKLAGPMSDFLTRVVPSDPLLILPSLFERFLGDRAGGLKLVDGRFVTEAEDGCVLFLTTSAPMSNAALLRPVVQGIEAAFERVDARFDAALRLHQSGTHVFSLAAEQSIKADIRRVSIGSALGLTTLFLVMFRSMRLLLLVLPIVAAGFLAGTSACLLLFGQVHGLTLAFGAALIGVSVDYGLHFHCHHLHAGSPERPRDSLRAVWPGLLLGALTTITGFAALVASSFPGLRQLATFAIVGIATAALTTHLFLPGLQSTRPIRTGATTWLAERLGALWFSPRRSRLALLLPLAAVLAVIAIGLPQLSWNGGIADLNKVDPVLEARDKAVRERVVRFEQSRLVVATGATEEAALQANDAIGAVLAQQQAAGALTGFRSLAPMLPSAAKQRAVDAAVRGDAQHWQQLSAALAQEGFVAAAFEPWRDLLAEAPPAPLRFAELAEGPLGAMVQPFRFTWSEGVGFVSFLHELHDADALRAALQGIDGAHLIDIAGTLGGAFGAYGERLLQLWLVGLAAVLLLVALRHRAVRPTLIAYVPAVLGAAGTTAVLALCGLQLNMLSLVALLMVVSMGVDYGVFLAEGDEQGEGLDATHLAVLVAGVSTIFGFGLLAISDQPALYSIGSTSGIGVLLCLVLAPTMRALTLGAPPPNP